MPDPRDDLIRRGDVLFVIESTVDIERADIDTMRERLRALPADPVAAAALALAEAKSRPNVCFGTLHDGSARYEGFECSTCGHKWYPGGPVLWPREEWHHEACPAGKYRAALAGRERGR